jgi:hypothetical protein
MHIRYYSLLQKYKYVFMSSYMYVLVNFINISYHASELFQQLEENKQLRYHC